MLQQRGYYTIELSSGEKISLRFCTWTFKRFCEINGNLSLKEFQELMMNGFSLSQFISFVLCASEYEFAKTDRPCPYKEIDASDWIDDLGGFASPHFIDMMQTVSNSFGGNNNHVQKKRPPEKTKS